MQTKPTQENRAFLEMLGVAKGWLAGRKPLEIAEKTGILYEEESAQFCFRSFGEEIRVHYPDYAITPYVDEWQQLLFLHYMKLADGTPLTGRWITMGEVKDGLIRGGDFDRRCEEVIRRRVSAVSPDEFAQRCRRIGGSLKEGKADLTVQFDLLPRYPLLVKIWFADEEFPASGKLLLDESAGHYLTIEDAVTAGQVLMEKLVGIF